MATFTPVVATQTVSKCAADLLVRLQSIAKLYAKSIFIFTEDDLQDKLKGIILPGAGIIYEGLRALPETGAARTGLSCEAVFSVIVVSQAETIANGDAKTPILNLLDELRNAILFARAPGGHLWRFVVEAATRETNGSIFWVQRWSTTIQLTSPGVRF